MNDPVDAVILAYLEHLEGLAPPPDLAHLTPGEQARAAAYLDGLTVARGLDRYAGRPSIEALLADTPLASLVAGPTGLAAVRAVLAAIDPRARVTLDASGVVLTYLDLKARFILAAAGTSTGATAVARAGDGSEAVRATVRGLFADDPDTGRVGVVAADRELTTEVFSPDDVGDTLTTPHGRPHHPAGRTLPLALAARALLEESAPVWPPFDVDGGRPEALDVAGLAEEVARRVIARESGRSYRGDKRRAYQGLVGREARFAQLVARLATPESTMDIEAEIADIIRMAA